MLFFSLGLSLFNSRRGIDGRFSFGDQPTRFLCRRHSGHLHFLNRTTCCTLHICNRNAMVHRAAVHDRDVRDIRRPIDDRDIVANDVLVNVPIVGIAFIHIHISIGWDISIDHLHAVHAPKYNLRRKWCPGDISAPFAPSHPRRRPRHARNPAPADSRRLVPTTIVVHHRTPVRLVVIRNPGPSRIAVNPMPHRIWSPSIRPVVRDPAMSIRRNIHPVAVRIQITLINRHDIRRRRLVRLRLHYHLRRRRGSRRRGLIHNRLRRRSVLNIHRAAAQPDHAYQTARRSRDSRQVKPNVITMHHIEPSKSLPHRPDTFLPHHVRPTPAF